MGKRVDGFASTIRIGVSKSKAHHWAQSLHFDYRCETITTVKNHIKHLGQFIIPLTFLSDFVRVPVGC